MAFSNVAEAYAFYKNTSAPTMEARAKAIHSDIAGNPSADIAAYNIELEAIEQAIAEKRDQKPAGYRTPEDKRPEVQHPGFTATAQGDAQKSTEYRSAFYKQMLGRDLSAAERAAFDAVNSEKRAGTFNTTANSGAVIPTTTLDEVITKARDMGGILSICRTLSIPANVSVPVATPTSMAEWHTEGAEVASEMAETKPVTFGAFELMKVLSISNATDAMSIDAFEAYLADELTATIMGALAKALVDGTGTGQPTGIATGVDWVEGTNLVTFDSSNWIGWRDLLKAVGMLHRGYGKGAAWVMSNATLYDSIFALHDDNDRPILLEDAKDGGTGYRLFGHPVVIDDFMAENDIIFGDFRYYVCNLPQAIRLDVSRESSFRSGLIDYRATAIADAKPVLADPFVRLTVSA